MVQGYKLRLGDGTTFAVDEKGLVTWLEGGLVDDKARIQPAGSSQWLSIRQLMAVERAALEEATIERLAAERAAARRSAADLRAEERAQGEGSIAALEQSTAEPLARASAELEWESEQQRLQAERQAAEERAEAERLQAEERAEAERRAAEELAAVKHRAKQERAARARRAEEERRAAELRAEAQRRAEAERLAEAERRAEAERLAEAERRAEAERMAEAERRAEAERIAEAERRAETERRAAARRAQAARLAAERAAAERREAEQRAALERQVEEEWLAVQSQAAEQRRAAQTRAAVPASEEHTPPGLRETDIELEPLAMVVEAEHATEEALLLQPLDAYRETGPSQVERRPAVNAAEEPDLLLPAASAPRPSSLAALEAGVIDFMETLLGWLDAAEERLQPAAEWLQRLRARAGSVALLRRPRTPRSEPPASMRDDRLTPTVAPTPPEPAVVALPPASLTHADPPRASEVPPLTLHELPIIPLAGGEALARANTVPMERRPLAAARPFLESPLGEALLMSWVWFKRITVMLALLLAAALLSSSVDQWMPGARLAAVALFTGMDDLKTRVAPSPLPPEAVAAGIAASVEQLPHLRRETIEAIMARTPDRVLEPSEVFRAAHEAAERGRAALPGAAAADLDRLTATLLSALPTAERGRLRQYVDKLRAGTLTVPYEDKEAAWLLVRAARRLELERLTRLRDLLAEAVSLGMTAGPSMAAAGPASTAAAAH